MKMKYMFKIHYLVTIMEHARIFVKGNGNTFCVRLNPAPRLQYNIQYTKQMKMKYM